MFWSSKKPKEERKPPYKIGDRFKYLGIDFICVDTMQYRLGEFWPAVFAEYKDNHGIIREKTFYENHFDLI